MRAKYQNANTEIASLTQRESSLMRSLAEVEADVQIYSGTLEDFKTKLALLEGQAANSTQSAEELLALRQSAEEMVSTQKNQREA